MAKGEDVSLTDSLRKKYLDSAYTYFSDNKNDSITRYFFRRSAVAYYDLSLYKKSLQSGKKALEMSVEAKDTVSMAKSWYYTGLAYYEKNYADSAFAAYTHAEKLYLTLDDPDTKGMIILCKAYIYYNNDEYVFCESEAFKALKLLKQANNTVVDIYKCYNLIASALDGQDNNEEAIKYFQKALDQLEEFPRDSYTKESIDIYKASCYNNIGSVYVKIKQYNKAISYYNEALAYENIKVVNPLLYAKLLHSLAYAKLKKGDRQDVLALFNRSLHIKDSLNNKPGTIASYISIGEYYMAEKDTITAISYLKKAYTNSSKINNSLNVLSSLKLLSDIDKVNSNFYSDKYIHVSDSVQRIAKANRTKFARIEYETDMLQLEKEELNRKNSFIIGVSVIVLLFVAAIFIIYYLNSRNKELLLVQEQQKANEEIYQLMFEQQGKIDDARFEEKNRIAMELHDGILNNIYAVRLNLEFSNRKTDDHAIEKRKGFIKELQHVEAEIRAVSHDLNRNMALDQNNNFETILSFMITSQKNIFSTEFEAYIDHDIDWANMPNTDKVNVYRIIQEALQNINKYSKALHAHVAIKLENKNITITITDDGIGFNTHLATEGIGLKNLKKRSEMLNGTLNIDSAPGEGTSIKVEFSL